MTEESPTVGFVVIGRNEGPRLLNCLKSVLAVSNRVVYADSASHDGSASVAMNLGVHTVVLPDDGELTAARGRNAGYADLVRHFPECDAIQFIDGDCILQPNWIEVAGNFLRKHSDVAVVCGRRFEANFDASVYNAVCDREWDTPIGEATECGGDALVRRSAFEQVGGYRASLRAGEEPEMTARMRSQGWRVWRLDAPMTEHDAAIFSLSQWWRRTLRGGYGFAQVWQATKGLPQRLYASNLRSAVTWAVALPLAVVATALITRQPLILLLIPAAYALQFVRLGLRYEGKRKWEHAALLLLAKFPETIGAAKYVFGTRNRRLPEYKNV